MMISARNQIDVTVERVEKGAVNALVSLKTPNGAHLFATVTNGSVDALALQTGDRVVAFFKASHVLLAPGWAMRISARNRLEGKVASIVPGSVNCEVVVSLPSGDKIASVVTNEAVRELAIKQDDDIVAIIKATDVMIAK